VITTVSGSPSLLLIRSAARSEWLTVGLQRLVLWTLSCFDLRLTGCPKLVSLLPSLNTAGRLNDNEWFGDVDLQSVYVREHSGSGRVSFTEANIL